jgi:hypothetical protein
MERIEVKSQPEQKVSGTPSQPTKAGCGGMHLSSQLHKRNINKRIMVQVT